MKRPVPQGTSRIDLAGPSSASAVVIVESARRTWIRAARLLESESSDRGTVISREQIVNLPTAGRSYQSFIGLMPGVAAPTALVGVAEKGFVTVVFDTTDRVSHMFWRGRDTGHPLHAESSDLARSAIDWIYGEADRIVGVPR